MYLSVNTYEFNSIFTLISINMEAIKTLNDKNYEVHLEDKIHSTTEDLLGFVKNNDQHSFRHYIFELIADLSEKAKTTRYNQDILDLIKDLTDLCKFNDDLRNVFYDSKLILLADFRGSDYDTYGSRERDKTVAFKLGENDYTADGQLLGKYRCYCCDSYDCQRDKASVENTETVNEGEKPTDSDDFDFDSSEFDFDDEESKSPPAGAKIINREAARITKEDIKQGVIEAEKKTSNSYVIHGRDLMQPWYYSFLPFLRKKRKPA